MIHAGGPRPGNRPGAEADAEQRGPRGRAGASGKTQKGNETTKAGKRQRPTRSTAGGARRAKSPPPWSAPAHPRSTQPPEPAGLGGTAGGPACLSDTQRAPSSARDHPQQHTPAVLIQAASAANRQQACQGRRLPPPPQRAEPLDRAQGRVLFRGGAAGPWARAARASQDPKATAGMGPRRLPRAQARRMGRTPKKPARPPQSCCGGTRAGGTGARARTTHTKRQKAQRKGPPSGAHKCNEAIITVSYQNKEQGRKLAPPALLWYHVIADNRIPQH